MDSENRKPTLEKIISILLDSSKQGDKQVTNALGKEIRERIAATITDESELAKTLEADKHDVLARITGKKKPKVKRLYKSLYWYGAAASIVILLGIMVFQNKTIVSNTNETIVSSDDVVKPGTDKATLTLENGTNIILEKSTSYQTANAKSNGEKITYTTQEVHTSEIAHNHLTVPRGGMYELELSDGTEVWLNSDSQLKYPVTFVKGETRAVELVYGEAYFDVSPSTEHKGSRFKVISDSQEVEVLGTEFNIKAYKDENRTYTTLVEGKVMVSATYANQLLKPDQQASLNRSTNQMDVTTVDVYNEVSWKKGVFSFKGKTLYEIMTVLGRWYDFETVFEDKTLKTVQFDGVLGKQETITKLLKTFKSATFITDYEIKDKTITLK